jgi:hypothetical protein
MKPAVLVTREVFDQVHAYLGEHFEVEQDDTPLSADSVHTPYSGGRCRARGGPEKG